VAGPFEGVTEESNSRDSPSWQFNQGSRMMSEAMTQRVSGAKISPRLRRYTKTEPDPLSHTFNMEDDSKEGGP